MMECSHEELRANIANSQNDTVNRSSYIVPPTTSCPVVEEKSVHSKVKEWKRYIIKVEN